MIYGNVGNIAAAVYLEMQLGGYMKKLTAFLAATLVAVSFAAAAGANAGTCASVRGCAIAAECADVVAEPIDAAAETTS